MWPPLLTLVSDEAKRRSRAKKEPSFMRSGEMLRQVEQMLAASQDEGVAISREIGRRQRLLDALRTVIEAGDDLAMAGYALVPLDPTEAMLRAAWGSLPGTADMIIAAAYRAMVVAAVQAEDPT